MTTGREASIERRQALSKGQTGLGAESGQQVQRRPLQGETVAGRRASVERRRQLSAGKEGVASPLHGASANEPIGTHEPQPKPQPSPPNAAAAPVAQTPVAARGLDERSGRGASIARRLRLSTGKTAIPGANLSTDAGIVAPDGTPVAGREASRLRRLQLSGGKAEMPGDPAAAAKPAKPPAQAESANDDQDKDGVDHRWAAVGRRDSESSAPARPGYPLKVVQSRTQSGLSTTGLRIGPGEQVTGDEDGATLPVTGNQYYGAETGAASRGRPVKVGAARTRGGLEVSGTLVRSQVSITGDERGDNHSITGQADQRLKDDLTPRGESSGTAQFPRRTDPHGHNAAASEFLAGRTGQPSRVRRSNATPHEITIKGHSVSGTAVGHSELMTGDEDGADRRITGTQYAASNRDASSASGLEPPAQGRRAVRLDPVTGAKVVEARTWGGQRVTGPAFEHVSQVTGSEAGSYVATTGTPYQGPQSIEAFLGPDSASAAAQRVIQKPSREAITGNTPLSGHGVTGIQRGAERDVTGTPYYREGNETAASGNPVSEIDQAFTIASPQRKAQLRAANRQDDDTTAGQRITGSFASGLDKITGAVEFLHTPRTAKREGGEPAVTGEGASAKDRITGDSWRSQSNVTGTEGYIAAGRNPTQKGGKRHGFAGAMKFRPGRPPFEPEYDVTGILIDKEAAALDEPPRVTVSGGAAT